MKRTFLLMALLVSVMLGSFIWFIATWDPEERPTLSNLNPSRLLFPNTPFAAPDPQAHPHQEGTT